MRRSRFLALSALYLAMHAALAGDIPQPEVKDGSSAVDVMTAIRTERTIPDRIANEFESLAGSSENAQNLVAGLRNARLVRMTSTLSAQLDVSFTPPTRPMNFSDIHKALSLAQAQLKSKRIDKPTPAHLKASLAGGELPNAAGEMTRVIGILPLYRRGMSWEQIARALRLDAPKRVAAIEGAATGDL